MATKNDHNNTKTKDGSLLLMEEVEMDISNKIKMLITIILAFFASQPTSKTCNNHKRNNKKTEKNVAIK